jgi:glycosyltransferase involved in cell wall biosynthesis
MLVGIDASRALRMPRTGTENYSLYLIRALAALDTQHLWRLYADRQPPAGLIEGERVEWRVMPWPRLWTHMRLAWEVTSNPPDVLFVPAHVIPAVRRCPAVVTVHDLGYLYHGAAHRPLDRGYLRASTQWNARVAHAVLADSEATREDLVAHTGCDPTKIVVAYPAGAEGLAPVTDAALLAQVQGQYGTGERYWLYLGTLQPRKNLETLIAAFARLSLEGAWPADIRLVLAGKPGWYYERIAACAAESGVSERIVFPGYVAPDDVAPLLSGALGFVLPSWYEGFGLPVQEAMACGTPVICSNVSSLPEVAGDAALLFDPRDTDALAEAMARLWQEPALRDVLARRGPAQAARFTWERCAETVLSVLESVAKKG